VETLVSEVAAKLRNAKKLSKPEAAALFNRNQPTLIEAARAHGQLLQWEAFTDAISGMPEGKTRQVLTWLRDLFGLGLIEENLAWYLMSGRLSVPRAQAVSAYRERLIARLRPHAADLVDAFGYGPEHIRASIASGAERERQDEARAYMRAQRESGNAPIEEKAMQAEEKLKQQKAGANA
ncbi:acyl-CoA dehydrogenase, partial [Pseudoclavibacter helvolus]